MNKEVEIIRPELTVNDKGEVVYTNPPPQSRKSMPHQSKPTPIMLSNEISKIFVEIMRNECDDNKMQGSYRSILFHLARNDGRTQYELAKLTHLKPPSVSVALAKLEKDGFVIRISDKMDLRKTRVFLTEKGKSIDIKANEMISKIDDSATENFTKEEYDSLMRLLLKLRNNLLE